MLGLGIVGCGAISARYLDAARRLANVQLVGATDLHRDRAEECARSFSGTAFDSLDQLLDDGRVDLVLNLTPPEQHAAVTRRGLEAGRHVYSEKPLALDVSEAHALADLAVRSGRSLACAPASVLGPSQQELMRLVRDGRLGEVRVAYGEADWGQADVTHPPPGTLMRTGPVADVGIYPLALMIACLGPVTSVQALARTLLPGRDEHDFVTATLVHHSGAVSRLTSTFYVQHRKLGSSVSFHGDSGTVRLDSWHGDRARIEFAGRGEPLPEVRPRDPGASGVDWSRGLSELVSSLRDGREPRLGAATAVHHVEVLEAIRKSAASGSVTDL